MRRRRPRAFAVEEATVADVHRALVGGRLTCRHLVERSLARIEAYDRSSGLNAIVVVNPRAVEQADALDRRLAAGGGLLPLHGVPLIVKDNYDTHDLQTAAGSVALRGSLPPDDAYQVRALRQAGAIVLAKSNMAEWAMSPHRTVSSLAGTTANPYDLARVPAGSSGGTAAAVAAGFGLAGLGTDTGNSIRGPASHTALVGIRSTLGATSRDGIVPLYSNRDVGGPMARTVEDAVRLFEVIVGEDPADPLTAGCRGRLPVGGFRRLLDRGGLRGVRLGVLRSVIETPTADPEIRQLTAAAIDDLRAGGAEVVDPFELPVDLEALQAELWCNTFRHDVEAYLASLGPSAPVRTLREVVDSGLYSPALEGRLRRSLEAPPPEAQDPPCLGVEEDPRRIALRTTVVAAMDAARVDAVLYPSWSNPPRKLEDRESPHGNNSPLIAPHTGQPAVTIPMGFTGAGLPAGLQLLGRSYSEPLLFRCAYAYERATRHRRPPSAFPPL